jgi:hypothetical protein
MRAAGEPSPSGEKQPVHQPVQQQLEHGDRHQRGGEVPSSLARGSVPHQKRGEYTARKTG